MILQRVSPVTHSVGNCVKRVVVIVASIFFFHTPISLTNSIGNINLFSFHIYHLPLYPSSFLPLSNVNKSICNCAFVKTSDFRHWNCPCWSIPIFPGETNQAQNCLKLFHVGLMIFFSVFRK